MMLDMADQPRDLRFSEATRIDRAYRQLTVSTKELQETARAFLANVDRAIAVAEFAPFALGLANLLRKGIASMRNPHIGRFSSGPLGNTHVSPPVPELFSPETLTPELRSQATLIGNEELDRWAACHSDVWQGAGAVLAAIVVDVWTAFEALAGDLWVEAVLARPVPLAHVAFANKPSLDRATVEKRARQKMRRLSGIMDAYRESFGAGATQSLFDRPEFAVLWVLEGVRNVLVHKGGHVDEMFLGRVNDHVAHYRGFDLHSVRKGELLNLDGERASRLSDAAVRASVGLIRFVDEWFTPPQIAATP
jgi:hypothetical protein